MDRDVTKVPKYGFKVKLDHTFPEKWTQGGAVTIVQIIKIFGLIIRLVLLLFVVNKNQFKKIVNLFSFLIDFQNNLYFQNS